MFTQREQEVLKYVCLGYSNIEIGQKLFISSHTAKAHVQAILRKLNLKNRTLVAFVAGKHNLVNIA